MSGIGFYNAETREYQEENPAKEENETEGIGIFNARTGKWDDVSPKKVFTSQQPGKKKFDPTDADTWARDPITDQLVPCTEADLETLTRIVKASRNTDESFKQAMNRIVAVLRDVVSGAK